MLTAGAHLWRLCLLLLLLGAGLAACGGADGAEDGRADLLRVGIPALPPSWGDPYRADGTPSSHTWAAIFDGLTRLDEDGKIAPALATDWQTQDGLVWDFTLRAGVGFSNGAPFNAAAAAATFNYLISPAGKATVVGSRVRSIASVAVRGPLSLRITLREPDAIFHKRLPSVAIVEPNAWAAGIARFAAQPVGTGPYRLVRFDKRKRHAVLEANPYAWRPPAIGRLRLIELTDEAVRQQALISGDVDLARVGLDDLDLLTARGVRTVTAPSMQVMSLALITEDRDGPLDDVRVRQALNLAVDKSALSKALMRGLAQPAGQPGAPGTTGYDPGLAAYPYDPAAARALLMQAGYPDGFEMAIEVVTGSLPSDSLIYQSVARYLADVGVRVQLRSIPFPVFLRRYLTNDWQADAFGLSWNAAPFNDVQRPMENFSCLKRPANRKRSPAP